MKKELMNLFMVLAICFSAYIFFKNFSFQEGLENNTSTSSSKDGVAGNAAGYAAIIKDLTVKLQDQFLITKYRKEYENIILNLDDYASALMLRAALNIDQQNPEETIRQISFLHQGKEGLNSVMKYIDAAN
jgi:hypothetical protein